MSRDLHARFGGDEFCFLIPDLPGCVEAVEIADRFKAAVEAHDWTRDDPRLSERPVRVDVGVVCLRLGTGRRTPWRARKLAAELIHRADTLMYDAKGRRSDRVHPQRRPCRERRAGGNPGELHEALPDHDPSRDR